MAFILYPFAFALMVVVRVVGRLTEAAIERPRENAQTNRGLDQLALRFATAGALYQARVFTAYPTAAAWAIRALRVARLG